MAKDTEEVVLDATVDLLKKIGIEAEVTVSETPEAVNVSIAGENLGALIGYHGETLESLQLILSLMLNHELKEGEWKRVVVDIGNWRAERLSTLENMVEQAVSDLKKDRLQRVNLPPMSPAQRREVHVIVTDKYPDLATESEGDEPHRRVVLFVKQ